MLTKVLMTRMTRTVTGLSSWMKRCFHVSARLYSWLNDVQKQPFRGVLLKRCSENMQQIYRRTPMPKCNFNKVALQLYWNRTSVWVFSCKFTAYFRIPFSKNTSERQLLEVKQENIVNYEASKKCSRKSGKSSVRLRNWARCQSRSMCWNIGVCRWKL